MKKKQKPVKKRYLKPDMGENAALRTGGGFHRGPRRAQNKLFRLIDEELELQDELKEVSDGI